MAKAVVREWVPLSEALARETAVWRDPEFAKERLQHRQLAKEELPWRYVDADGVAHENDFPARLWGRPETKINWQGSSALISGLYIWSFGPRPAPPDQPRPPMWIYRIDVFVPATPGKPPVKMGRPSARELVRAEAERQLREEPSQIPDSLKRWGDVLAGWLAEQPSAPVAKGGTCEAYVRHLYKLAKARKAIKSGK
jgi:hypothetical protein